jgi:hypothetical protein
MAASQGQFSSGQMDAGSHSGMRGVFLIAALIALLHILTNNRYGFHRDELQTLSDGLHLDWGFVAYPPFTPFIERIGLGLFGLSLVWLRMFSVIAQSAAIIVSGLMAKELGGGRLAQIAAALSVALSPLPLFEGTEFQYSSFDFLWWVLIAYFVIRLVNTENPRWWLAIGAITGLGLMTKYTMAFYMAGILAGLIFTPARRFLRSGWLWTGVGITLLICLPNIWWQAHHEFISYHFLKHIHARDVRQGRADGFLRYQLYVCANLFAAPLWIAGIIGFLRNRRYRILAWMYIVPLAIFFFSKARFYYLAAAYPMLMAMGAVAGERWVKSLRRPWRVTLQIAYFTGVVVAGAWMAAIIVPLASHGPLKQYALKNNGDLREEIGWQELAKTVAQIRDTVPADQRQNVGVLVGNYGERGAIEMFGPAYHIPPPISTTNSGWLLGYPTPPPSILIVVGWSQPEVERTFTSCRLAGHNGDPAIVENEESMGHPDIFLCGPPRDPWPKYWDDDQRYG